METLTIVKFDAPKITERAYFLPYLYKGDFYPFQKLMKGNIPNGDF